MLTAAFGAAGCDPGPDIPQEFANPSGPGSRYPHLSATTDGELLMSWLHDRDDGVTELRWSRLGRGVWSPARTIASGDDWFVNWADFPSLIQSDDLLAAHWLARRPGGTYAYDVAMAFSHDDGATWTETLSPHSDNTPTEHGFVSLVAAGDAVHAVWLDGRDTQPDSHSDASDHEHAMGAMTLRYAIMAPRAVARNELQLDARVCDCCQTDSVAIGNEVVVVYRDRDDNEIRDIAAVVIGADGRIAAQTPVANDHWKINGCPVNGPAIDANDEGLVVAWYTAAGGRPAVRLARSFDAGRSFDAPVDVDIGAQLTGRVDVALLPGSDALVSWIGAGKDAPLLARRVGRNGKPGPVRVVASVGVARATGVPQMQILGDHTIFAWTESTKPPRVRLTRRRTAEL